MTTISNSAVANPNPSGQKAVAMLRLASRLGLVLALLSLSGTLNAGVTYIDASGNDFRISTVTDVDVNGVTYDATFYHGISYQQFIGIAGNPTPDFGGIATADANAGATALVLLIDALSADASTATQSTQSFYVTTMPHTSGDIVNERRDRLSLNPLDYSATGPQNFFNPNTTVLQSDRAFVDFQTIPEPSSAGLLAAGLLAVGWRRTRRV